MSTVFTYRLSELFFFLNGWGVVKYSKSYHTICFHGRCDLRVPKLRITKFCSLRPCLMCVRSVCAEKLEFILSPCDYYLYGPERLCLLLLCPRRCPFVFLTVLHIYLHTLGGWQNKSVKQPFTVNMIPHKTCLNPSWNNCKSHKREKRCNSD